MLEKYNDFFDLYLRCGKHLYDPEKPYDDLEKCITTVNDFREQLIGMVDLIHAMNGMSDEEADREIDRIISTFSSIKICGAFMEKGDVMLCRT